LNLDDYLNGHITYVFATHKPQWRGRLLQVPVMSSCGMMISRRLMVDVLRCWPEELGIYQGGEHYICFTLGRLGIPMRIAPVRPLAHYAEKRGYNYTWPDLHRNRLLAMAIVGGEGFARTYAQAISDALKEKRTGDPNVSFDLLDDALSYRSVVDRMEYVEANAVRSLQEYVDWSIMEFPDLVRSQKYLERLEASR
jgi:hypothetical protein